MRNKKKNADRKEFHIIYKTVCLITERFYIGMHSTDNLDDGYQGSGKQLIRSINKHGKDNHVTETLETLPNRKALAAREKEIVNEKFLEDTNCMNIMIGGQGGYISKEHYVNRTVIGNKAFKDKLENDHVFNKMFKEKMAKIMNGNKYGLGNTHWLGRKHTTASKIKMSIANAAKTPEQNSQFGTCWITNEVESKKIKKDTDIPEGWRLGRKTK
jgi:hypothetical protein